MWIFKVGSNWVVYDASQVQAGLDAPGAWGFTLVGGGTIAATQAYIAQSLAAATAAAALLEATNNPGGSATFVWAAS